MASKEKLLDSAQKFIAKGQIAKAIGEYQKLVDAFPKDYRYRQKIAELLTRDQRNEEAQPHYEAVAKNFAETGFYLKAIAIYKQMQKVDPGQTDIYLRLAELNEKQGLLGNALTEYRSLIACYEKNKQMRNALPVLQKMVALDPDNLGVRGKLIETLISCHEDESASEQFRALVTLLEGKGEYGKIVKLYEKFQALCGDTATDQLPLARALVASEQAGKALPVLKGLLKQDPEHADVLGALADCHLALGSFEDARLTCQHLLKNYPDNLLLRERYVRICLAAGDRDRALASLEEARSAFSREGQNTLFRELYRAVQGDQSDPAVAPTVPAGDAESMPEEPSSLLQESLTKSVTSADVASTLVFSRETRAPEIKPSPAVSPGRPELDLDLDLDLHRPVAATAPETEVSAPPSAEKPAAAPDQPQEDQELELELELDLGAIEEEADSFVEASPSSLVEEPAESTGVVTDFELEAPSFAAAARALQEPVGETEFELPVESEPRSFGADPEGDSVAASELELELPTEPVGKDDRELHTTEYDLPDLGDFEPVVEVVAEEPGREHAAELEAEPEMPSTAVPEEEPSVTGEAAAEGIPAACELEVESGPGFIVSGDAVPAVATEEPPPLEELEVLDEIQEIQEIQEEPEELEELEELVELEDVEELEVVEIAAGHEELADAGASPGVPGETGGEPVEEVAVIEGVPVEGPFTTVPGLLAEGLEEAEFYLRQGLFDDAERVLGELQNHFASHPEILDKLAEIAALRQAPTESEQPPAPFDGFADIKEDELLGGIDDAEAVESVVDEFSLESPVEDVESEDDLQSHFDLGIAYKEMGLLDDAVVEFDRASRDPSRRLDCLTLKGQCQLEMGQPAAAESTYRQALDIPLLSDEGRLVLCYELGLLYETLGRKRDALDHYQIVANIDLFFRDVTDKLRMLRQELGVDDQAIEDVSEGGSGRDRISFI